MSTPDSPTPARDTGSDWMLLNLGPYFEQTIIDAAGLAGLNIDPGSMRIDLINQPDTTVRFTLVATVPGSVVEAAIRDTIGGT